MRQKIVMEKYPINEYIVSKSETTYSTVDEVIASLKEKIEAHPVAVYIATFDHYAHTKSLGENGDVSADILDAKNIICCFGKQLPKPEILAIRPRAIGVAELEDSFFISFMDAPNPRAHDAMISWIKAIANK